MLTPDPHREHLRRAALRHAPRDIANTQGGSIKGTTLQFGGFGLRLISAVRLTAAQLTAAQVALKRKIKPIKGAQVHLRVFPDVPVCVKGNETRMGKGKGSFEYWATRVPAGRVVFEIAGGGIREEIARQALKLAQVKIPVPTEFITTATPPRLGSIVSNELSRPVEAQKTVLGHNPLTPIQQVAAAQNGAKESEAEAEAEAESKEKVQA